MLYMEVNTQGMDFNCMQFLFLNFKRFLIVNIFINKYICFAQNYFGVILR